MNPGHTRNLLRKHWMKHVMDSIDINFHISEDNNSAFVTHPGPSFTDFDQYGNLNICCLMHLTNSAFSLAIRQLYTKDDVTTSFLKWIDLFKDRTMFVAATKFTVSRVMYNPSVSKRPVGVKITLENVGSTSVLFSYQFFLPGNKEPYLTRLGKMVSIDKETRKPFPLPDWFRSQWKESTSEVSDFRVNKFPRPSQTFVHRLKILFSETDENNHTNFTSYVKFGLDTLHLALLQQSKKRKLNYSDAKECKAGPCSTILTAVNGSNGSTQKHGFDTNTTAVIWLTEDIISQGVKDLEICYLKECVEGDEVDVHVWQEKGAEFSIKCSVEGLDKSLLCQFILEFFSPSHNL